MGADVTRKENEGAENSKPAGSNLANNRESKGFSFGTAANKDKDKTEFEQGRMPGPGQYFYKDQGTTFNKGFPKYTIPLDGSYFKLDKKR